MSEVALNTLNNIMTSSGDEVIMITKDESRHGDILYRAKPIPSLIGNLNLDVIDSEWIHCSDNILYLHLLVNDEYTNVVNKIYVFYYDTTAHTWSYEDITPDVQYARHCACSCADGEDDLYIFWYGTKATNRLSYPLDVFDTIVAAPFDGGYESLTSESSDKLICDNQFWKYTYSNEQWTKLNDDFCTHTSYTGTDGYLRRCHKAPLRVVPVYAGNTPKGFCALYPSVLTKLNSRSSYDVKVGTELFFIDLCNTGFPIYHHIFDYGISDSLGSFTLTTSTGLAEALSTFNTTNSIINFHFTKHNVLRIFTGCYYNYNRKNLFFEDRFVSATTAYNNNPYACFSSVHYTTDFETLIYLEYDHEDSYSVDYYFTSSLELANDDTLLIDVQNLCKFDADRLYSPCFYASTTISYEYTKRVRYTYSITTSSGVVGCVGSTAHRTIFDTKAAPLCNSDKPSYLGLLRKDFNKIIIGDNSWYSYYSEYENSNLDNVSAGVSPSTNTVFLLANDSIYFLDFRKVFYFR